MEKKPNKWSVLGAASALCLVASVIIYVRVFTLNDALLGSWRNPARWRGKLGTGNGDEGKELEGQSLNYLLRRLVRGNDLTVLKTLGFSCHTDLHSEICLSSKPVRVTNGGLTVYMPSNGTLSTRAVRPYARREDNTAMERVAPVKILHGEIDPPACDFTYRVPALVFSSGGFTGNAFHELNEIIIPLFLTVRHLRSRVRFIVTDYKSWWVDKYKEVLSHLSDHEVLNYPKIGGVHCFPGAVVGLKYHDNLAINRSEIPGGLSMLEFRRFLRDAYTLKATDVREMAKKPNLLLISRNETRRVLNEDSMVGMMEELGFQVVVRRPGTMLSLKELARIVSSCSVMVGAHGAGLTHELFLPDGAVVVQIIPLGLDWASSTYFGQPAVRMGLKYLPYKIKPEESSLSEKYGLHHPVVTDIESVFAQGYYAARAVYVDGQSMNIDLVRFRKTLTKAMQLIGIQK